MMKFNCSLLAAALLAGTVVLSSCSSDELPVGNEVQQLATESAMTYSFSAPAVMGDEADTRVFEIGESSIDSRFSDSENIYVYLKRKDTIAYGSQPITPSKVSDDGKSCTITAPEGFTFVSETSFTPAVGDEVYYYYGMTPNPYSSFGGYYDFSTNGTKADVEKKDFCLAEMVVKDVDMDKGKLVLGQKEDQSKEYFTFKNINSIFRQKLIFYDRLQGNVITPTIKEIVICNPGGSEFSQNYYPFSTKTYGNAPIRIQYPDLTDGNIYFSMMFNELNKETMISFTAIDTNDKLYHIFKKPGYSNGKQAFNNNKYYYGKVELIPYDYYIKQLPQFDDVPYYINDGYFLSFVDGTTDITFSGNSEGAGIEVMEYTTVTLDNINAIYSDSEYFLNYINYHSGTANLNLKGNNKIKSDYKNSGALSEYSAILSGFWPNKSVDLKLKCKGEKASITFIENNRFIKGFSKFANLPNLGYSYALTAEYLKDIAAEGYTVERTAVTECSAYPGYYEVTFTVKKK